MLPSVLAALAVVHAASLDLDRAIADLARIEPLAGRMRTVEIPGGHTYLLDTWKAPLWSTQKLVDDLPAMSAGRRIFVLGDMSDIGNSPGNKYRRVLRHAVANADLVIGIGSASGPARRLREAESSLNIRSLGSIEALGELLAGEPSSLVVLKGNKLRWEQLPGVEEHSRA
jgi:UDP-N-acetylmuramyl pentapeptide synthase